ncbi:hypothetical protein [Streptomyces sp. UG1]|uniref:hypothetical protein n=1 Tax=Streptomyces sp. UG1 TaxID=3417652 RepID=UPI003CF118DC
MTRQRNTELEALLTEFGFTHAQLAEEVNRVAVDEFGEPANCTDRHVRRWVSGAVRWPWPRYLRPLEHIFGRSPQQMGFVPRAGAPEPQPPAPPSAPARSAPAKEHPPVQRRTFIAASLIAALGIDRTPWRGRIGMSDVDRVQGTITRLDAHFNGLGGGALGPVAKVDLVR